MEDRLARATRRYLDLLRDALLDVHYLENELRINHLIESRRRRASRRAPRSSRTRPATWPARCASSSRRGTRASCHAVKAARRMDRARWRTPGSVASASSTSRPVSTRSARTASPGDLVDAGDRSRRRRDLHARLPRGARAARSHGLGRGSLRPARSRPTTTKPVFAAGPEHGPGRVRAASACSTTASSSSRGRRRTPSPRPRSRRSRCCAWLPAIPRRSGPCSTRSTTGWRPAGSWWSTPTARRAARRRLTRFARSAAWPISSSASTGAAPPGARGPDEAGRGAGIRRAASRGRGRSGPDRDARSSPSSSSSTTCAARRHGPSTRCPAATSGGSTTSTTR